MKVQIIDIQAPVVHNRIITGMPWMEIILYGNLLVKIVGYIYIKAVIPMYMYIAFCHSRIISWNESDW